MRQIEKHQQEGYLIVYMDETWFDSHNTAGMVWLDDTEKYTHSAAPPSKGKRIVICHTGTTESCVPNSLLLCGKKLSESYASYHDDMNGEVFEDWFKNTLLKNLPQDRQVLIVMDNAKYHSTLSEKTLTINMKENDMIPFTTKYNIKIPPQFPVKSVLLEKIHEANIPKKYLIDEMASAAGHSVLRLPPCYCAFNPIEMVWNQLKYHTQFSNIYTGQPEKVLNLFVNVCDHKIAKGHRENYVSHVITQGKEFRKGII